MLRDDLLGGCMQLSRSAIVTESLPELEHLGLIRRRKFRDGWKSGNKSIEVINDGDHLGLLQHDFADPDGVTCRLVAPRQFPLVLFEPANQRAAELRLVTGTWPVQLDGIALGRSPALPTSRHLYPASRCLFNDATKPLTGALWGDPAYAGGGHAVHTTGAVQDSSGQTLAYTINDTGTNQQGRVVPAADYASSMDGGDIAVTDNPVR